MSQSIGFAFVRATEPRSIGPELGFDKFPGSWPIAKRTRGASSFCLSIRGQVVHVHLSEVLLMGVSAQHVARSSFRPRLSPTQWCRRALDIVGINSLHVWSEVRGYGGARCFIRFFCIPLPHVFASGNRALLQQSCYPCPGRSGFGSSECAAAGIQIDFAKS